MSSSQQKHSLLKSFKKTTHKAINNGKIQQSTFMKVTDTYLLSHDEAVQNRGRSRLIFHMLMRNAVVFCKWLLYDLFWLVFFYSFVDYANRYIENVYNARHMTPGLLNAAIGTEMVNAAFVAGSMIIMGYAIIRHGLVKWAYPKNSVEKYINKLQETSQRKNEKELRQENRELVIKLLTHPSKPNKNHRTQLRRDLIKELGQAKGSQIYQEFSPMITKDGHLK